jgi:hypothetical protein
MYSGAINAGDVPSFSGLAEAGDRLTRLTLSFYPGLSDPDVGLTVAAPQDYRGTEDVYVYDDAVCSVSRSGRSAHSFVLPLFGLAMVRPGLLASLASLAIGARRIHAPPDHRHTPGLGPRRNHPAQK